MVINKKDGNTTRVEFVSYTGQYPNLCNGVLTLKIDGEMFKFGHDYRLPDTYVDGHFDKFWTTGGRTYFTHGYRDEHVEKGEWLIDVERLPEQFWDLADEIDVVFNQNVELGCCGGCL